MENEGNRCPSVNEPNNNDGAANAIVNLTAVQLHEVDHIVGDVEVKRGDAENEQEKEEEPKADAFLTKAIYIVVGHTSVSDETRERLRLALDDVFSKGLNKKDASTKHRLVSNFLMSYCELIEKLMKRLREMDECGDNDSAIPEELKRIKVTAESTDCVTIEKNEHMQNGHENGTQEFEEQEISDQSQRPERLSQSCALDECIKSVCSKLSKSDSARKKALTRAVKAIIQGESSVAGAAKSNDIPLSTLHFYVSRVRKELNANSTPSPDEMNNVECVQNNNDKIVEEKQSIGEKSEMEVEKSKKKLSVSPNLPITEVRKRVLENMPSKESARTSQKRLKSLTSQIKTVRKHSNSRRVTIALKSMNVKSNSIANEVSAKSKQPSSSVLSHSPALTLAVSSHPSNVNLVPESNLSPDEQYVRDLKCLVGELGKTLVSANFDDTSVEQYQLTKEELKNKIAEVLRRYYQKDNHEEMRDNILKVFYLRGNAKSMPDEVTCYARVVNAYLLAETWAPKVCDPMLRERMVQEFMDLTLGALSSGRYAPLEILDGSMIHIISSMASEEHFVKSLISYLIHTQYRRSEDAQNRMKTGLEHVLLDGLSVAESLKLHANLPSCIFMIYLKRCRDTQKILKDDFPAFKATVMKILKQKTWKVLVSLDDLKGNVPTAAQNLLYDYLKKLYEANFPVDKRLTAGLFKSLLTTQASKYSIDDVLLTEWCNDFCQKHSDIRF